MIDLDIASLTALTRLFAADMRARKRGHILMVASLLSFRGVKNFAVYSAAKAYVLRFSDALHRELKMTASSLPHCARECRIPDLQKAPSKRSRRS